MIDVIEFFWEEKKIFIFNLSMLQKMSESAFIHNWRHLDNAFDHPAIDKDIKYKRCGNCIVQMRRIHDTEDNELRTNVYDTRYAKYRANKLMVVKIYDTWEGRFVPNIQHSWYNFGVHVPIDYVVGEKAVPNGFDENIETICAKGIHYFNTLFAAYCYRENDVLELYDNGSFLRVCPHSSHEEDKIWFDTQLHQSNVIC